MVIFVHTWEIHMCFQMHQNVEICTHSILRVAATLLVQQLVGQHSVPHASTLWLLQQTPVVLAHTGHLVLLVTVVVSNSAQLDGKGVHKSTVKVSFCKIIMQRSVSAQRRSPHCSQESLCGFPDCWKDWFIVDMGQLCPYQEYNMWFLMEWV